MMLKGKVALITGSSRGIGGAIAIGFAKEGADVVVNYSKSEEPAMEVAGKINKLGVKVTAIQADVSKVSEAKRLVEEAWRKMGKIDILVNNAATGHRCLSTDVKEEFWDSVLDTNLKGCFFCSQAVAKLMIKRKKGGRIINISSINTQRAEPYWSPYVASKGGMESLTRTMAAELGPYQITVNAVSVGAVLTEMSEYIHSEEARKIKERKTPLGTIAKPEDIVPAVIFFASDNSWYVTGQVLMVDGGSFVNANREVSWAKGKYCEKDNRPPK